MKAPAFLFYSRDFYEGTRMMLPEERACFMDLLVYQHQYGEIPFDLKRPLLYCSGISEATLQATLEAKFKRGLKGWYNPRLKGVIETREEYSEKNSLNGLVGQFFKKAKKRLDSSEFQEFKNWIYQSYSKEKLIDDIKKEERGLEATLEGLLKHYAIAIANGNVKEEKRGLEKKEGKKPPFHTTSSESEILSKDQPGAVKPQQLLQDQAWLDSVGMGAELSPPHLKAMAEEFFRREEIKLQKDEYRSRRHLQEHFANWVTKNRGRFENPDGEKLKVGAITRLNNTYPEFSSEPTLKAIGQ